ncbi:uncharacterized protein LOC129597348 [Paramacrobiotus metropolitanus]|uniref:uncharacterized protein LOC129597348 n=1 Tax=Paramacrobiotus metropolitanus TaxID=2943436 RepID=UPI0024461EEC|nr:uncharacterized protein LOC129597348 [Paramacrobiotus metropolitanus]
MTYEEQNGSLRLFLSKYSLDEILKLCTVCTANRSLDIMDTVLLEELAHRVQLAPDRLRDMYIHVMNEAPSLLDLISPSDPRSIVVITPPVKTCTEGCVYQRGSKTGLPLELGLHNKPAWGTLHDINGMSRSFVRLSYRCPTCRSIYKLHCKASFNGFCETYLETYGKAAGFDVQNVSEAFFRYETENEVRENNLLYFGFSSDKDVDQAFPELDKLRCERLYPHVCYPACASRGCREYLIY